MRAHSHIELRLSELRLRHNRMTQAELAKRAGLSKTTISNLESGDLKRIELDTIAKLCRALDCTPNELFAMVEVQDAILIEQQRQALLDVLGTIDYQKPADPETLDQDLATITQEQLLDEASA